MARAGTHGPRGRNSQGICASASDRVRAGMAGAAVSLAKGSRGKEQHRAAEGAKASPAAGEILYGCEEGKEQCGKKGV